MKSIRESLLVASCVGWHRKFVGWKRAKRIFVLWGGKICGSVRGTANFGRRTYAVRLQDRNQRNDLKVTTPGNRYSVRAVWLHL